MFCAPVGVRRQARMAAWMGFAVERNGEVDYHVSDFLTLA